MGGELNCRYLASIYVQAILSYGNISKIISPLIPDMKSIKFEDKARTVNMQFEIVL